jgi:hypothetical protein
MHRNTTLRASAIDMRDHGYRRQLMSDPASKGLDAVVNEDGSLVVSADQAAQLNLKPGDHLRLVPRHPTSFGEILDGIAEG